MPTGYTAGVQDGKITEFPDFALGCARAFGALIMMRDEPNDAPIPEEFKPNDYHVEAKAKAETELARLVAMTEAEAHDAARAEFEAALKDLKAYREEADVQRKRYGAMLVKVRAWTPPTPDHEGLKDFMAKQLQESIDHDCDTSYRAYPSQLTGKDWLVEAIAKAQKDVGYHTKELIVEEGRARTRTEWVKSLRLSLRSQVPA